MSPAFTHRLYSKHVSSTLRATSSFSPLTATSSSSTLKLKSIMTGNANGTHPPSSMRTLTSQSLNPAILSVEYAVRGELAIRAEKYRNDLKKPNHGLPFHRVISSNIGNPQQIGLDQPALTFPRQVSSFRNVLCAWSRCPGCVGCRTDRIS